MKTLCFASYQLLELTTIVFRDTKKLKIIMLPIKVNNHSFQSYLKYGRRYASDQLLPLTMVPFREI